MFSDIYDNVLESDVDLKDDYVGLSDPNVNLSEKYVVHWMAQTGSEQSSFCVDFQTRSLVKSRQTYLTSWHDFNNCLIVCVISYIL